MITCPECVHVGVCEYYAKSFLGLFDAGADEKQELLENCEQDEDDVCEYALASNRVVALPQPVKPGDKLWYILDGLDAIDLRELKTTRGNSAVGDDPDIVFDVSTRGFWIVGVRRKDTEQISFNDCFLVPWDEFGKTYFLSREAAGRALEKRGANGQSQN